MYLNSVSQQEVSAYVTVLQWCYDGVTVECMRTCGSSVAVALRWCYSDVSIVLQWCYSAITVNLNSVSQQEVRACVSVESVLQWRYDGVAAVFQL
jgi:hypothetical protein